MPALVATIHDLAERIIAVVAYPCHESGESHLPEPIARSRQEVARRRRTLQEAGVLFSEADRQARTAWTAEQILSLLQGHHYAFSGERIDEIDGKAGQSLVESPGASSDTEQPQPYPEPACDGPPLGSG